MESAVTCVWLGGVPAVTPQPLRMVGCVGEQLRHEEGDTHTDGHFEQVRTVSRDRASLR